MTINWNYPKPRAGMAGTIDQLFGPGATRAEVRLQTIIPVVAVIASLLYAAWIDTGWSLLQQVVCAFFAFDIVGGIVTNATSSAKRWFHRAGRGAKQHMCFVLVHLVHLTVISWLFLSFDLLWIVITGVYLVVAALCITSSALYLQRPIAMIFYVGSLLITLYGLEAPIGLEWFLPLFYIKLLLSHLPKEEPYRPVGEL